MKVTSWKNWPYWVKGGLISVSLPILSLVLVLIQMILVKFFLPGFLFLITLFLLSFVSYVPYQIASMLGIHLFDLDAFGIFPTIPGAIFVLCVWFIAGAVIGMIVGKIKSKHKTSSNSPK